MVKTLSTIFCVFLLTTGIARVSAVEAGRCQVPQEPERVVCEIGSGFLCVDTPDGGIAAPSLRLHGTIDVTSSALGNVRILVQHGYTNQSTVLDTSHPQTSDCLSTSPLSRPFCIDAEGYFAAEIPLEEVGPYSILVSATRLSGEPAQKIVSVSRVQPVSFSEENLAFDPDVRTSSTIDTTHVTVTASLLDEGCTFCDFIGAATGGVTVSVINNIEKEGQAPRRIECATTVEQGGAGRFVVGIPVEGGKNTLTISACNAAHESACPTVEDISFIVEGGTSGFTIHSPDSRPAYDAREFPTIPFSFSLEEGGEHSCVDIIFNREEMEDVCPDASGRYSLELHPQAGINVVAVQSGDHLYPWTFGWGTITSPVESGTLVVPDAFAVALPPETFQRVFLPMLTSSFSSDEFQTFLNNLTLNGGDAPAENSMLEIKHEIPFCSEGGAGPKISMRGDPQVGNIKVENLSFSPSTMAWTLNGEDIRLGLDIALDEGSVLPLVIGFKKVWIDLAVAYEETENGNLLLLTSPHTDCDFRSRNYCHGNPAPIIPEHFVGNAGALGHFVACDVDAASDDVRELCRSFNTIDAQTGIPSGKVLDAINGMITCSGSTMLTNIMRKGISFSPFSIPMQLGFDGGVDIGTHGMRLKFSAAFTRAAAEHESVGLVSAPSQAGNILRNLSRGHLIDAALAEEFLNAVLFAGSTQAKGLLDIDIHEPFFEKFGFDFDQKCEGVAEPHALCNIRPRVNELLGSSLTSFGYLSPDHPVMMRLRSNRNLSPHISLVLPEEVPVVRRETEEGETLVEPPSGKLVDVQFGGLELAFYALEVDGNGDLLLDAEGNLVIRSMRPEDPDPSAGHIIRFDVNLLLTLEVNVGDDITVRPLADRSRLVMTALESTNATTIPASQLVAPLRDKLNIALVAFSAPEKAIHIPLPQEIALPENLLGIREIDFGPDGLSLEMRPEQNSIAIGLDALITQVLHRDNTELTLQYPQ